MPRDVCTVQAADRELLAAVQHVVVGIFRGHTGRGVAYRASNHSGTLSGCKIVPLMVTLPLGHIRLSNTRRTRDQSNPLGIGVTPYPLTPPPSRQVYKHVSRKVVSAATPVGDSGNTAGDSGVLCHTSDKVEARAASPETQSWLPPSNSTSRNGSSKSTRAKSRTGSTSGMGQGGAGMRIFDAGVTQTPLLEWASILVDCEVRCTL